MPGLSNSFDTDSTGWLLTDVKVTHGGAFRQLHHGACCERGSYPATRIQALGTWSDTAVSANGGVYDFRVNPGVSLNANIRYFITLCANNSGSDAASTYWATTDSTSGTRNIAAESNCFRRISCSQTEPECPPRLAGAR